MRLGHWVDVMTSARSYRLVPAATVAAVDAIRAGEEGDGSLVSAATTSGQIGASPVSSLDIGPVADTTLRRDAVPTSATLAAVDLSTAQEAQATATQEPEVAPASADDIESLCAAPDNVSGENDDDDTMDDDVGGIDVQDDENDFALEPWTPMAAASEPAAEWPVSMCIGTAPPPVVDNHVASPRPSAATTPVGSPAHPEPSPASAYEPDVGAPPAIRTRSPPLEAHVDDQSTPLLQALETFKIIYHHLEVPQDFVVEAMEPWPASVHGLQLGGVVISLRLLTPTGLAPWMVARLDALGFEWTPLCFDLVNGAMQHLADEHPAYPPLSFVVPAQPPWPQDLWDVDLLQLSAKRDAWLAEMAIQYSDSASLALLRVPSIEPLAVTFNKVYPVQLVLQCIEVYQALHGQALIPLLFHVPLRDAKWPQDASLMPLGYFVWAAQDQWANLDPLVRNAISAFGLSPDDDMDDGCAIDNDDLIDGDVGGEDYNDQDMAGPVNIDPRDELDRRVFRA
ncbi:hypothetical protein SDRG_15939 [Saprolegnia diclina VS20]|uniref:Helicase-associated domain-containing protein n=1 Tax=Saprolegnia diclina (strain VS20) TaxID=1156394 RepID=T0R9L4_SAPDV|nr:hypothetical protein SDRG_15939 [Saprolegnia diclina VS20]EQC26202.1 hypothetical protein SDRG_15939 [Saprolegnia diclina VS20]|eukprot:XP_008620347.1 hypothetical protein SDRG_15939 [Saprolegnia diclina VS20]